MKKTNTFLISHLLTTPEQLREQNSINQISRLGSLRENFHYNQIINKPHTELPPNDNVIFGNKDWVVGKEKELNTWGLTSGHYGCYKAHINAILDFFNTSDKDFLLICECDCKINIDYDFFIEKLYLAADLLCDTDYKLFSFCHPNFQTTFKNKIDNDIYEADLIICAHMYLINKKQKKFFQDIISKYGWHTIDWWFNMVFNKENENFLCFKDLNLTSQFEGKSQIDRGLS